MLAGKIDEHGSTYLADGNILHISPKDYVASYIEENKLEKRLIVTGFREDILALIAAMDVLVVPNKNGVLGRQPIEAQALGVTVIAQTGHSQKSKIVEHGVTGYLIKSIEEAIEQINQLVQHNEVNKLEQSAQNHAQENFSPIMNMRKIEHIYLNLLKH